MQNHEFTLKMMVNTPHVPLNVYYAKECAIAFPFTPYCAPKPRVGLNNAPVKIDEEFKRNPPQVFYLCFWRKTFKSLGHTFSPLLTKLLRHVPPCIHFRSPCTSTQWLFCPCKGPIVGICEKLQWEIKKGVIIKYPDKSFILTLQALIYFYFVHSFV